MFQSAYAAAFDDAQCICIKEPPGLESIPEQERLNAGQLVADITNRGKEAFFFKTSVDLLDFLKGYCSSRDMVVCMSNGSFDGLPQNLLKALNQPSS